MNAGFGIHSIIFALFRHQTSIDELLRHFVNKQGACVITKLKLKNRFLPLNVLVID
jgi:hypothetical protein